ncbi:MAG: hypothetical protein EA350_10860 [Gemmatimonadales bacterium]|nr:MAG: hypothetical protein EA350_10860 [Gemmatimonadales bacterium]
MNRRGTGERTVARVGAVALVLGLGLGAGGCGLLFEDPGAPEPRPADDAAGMPTMPEDTVSAPGSEVAGRTGPLDTADPRDPSVRAALAEAGGLPAGLGTLRQEEIAIRVRRGELEMFVVPLHEGVTRTAAPDTWERLSALALSHRRWFRERTGSDAPYRLFLVALYSEAEPLAFEADELTLVSGGLRLRHVMLRGLTPGWDQQRLQPGESQMAVYAFPPEVVLSGDLEVEYQEVRSRDWSRILPVVEAERRRVRTRVGGT